VLNIILYLQQYSRNLERLTRIESNRHSKVVFVCFSYLIKQCMMQAANMKMRYRSLSQHLKEYSVHVSISFSQLYFWRAQFCKISVLVVCFYEFVPSFYCELIIIDNLRISCSLCGRIIPNWKLSLKYEACVDFYHVFLEPLYIFRPTCCQVPSQTFCSQFL
jgi:hypothetical protein